MRNAVLICGLLAIVLAVSIQARPQGGNNNKSPNPQVNLLRQGLIEKLCRNQLKNSGTASSTTTTTSTTTSTTSTTARPTRKALGNRRARQTADVNDPACAKYSDYTFAQLIAENKKLLKPVGTSGRRT